MRTNLSKIKETAITFLYLDIEKTEVSPIVIQHPIFESAFTMLVEKGKSILVNILEDEESYQKVLIQTKNRISRARSVTGVFYIIRQPYRLVFLSYIKEYLSEKDFAKLFADAWICSENPNTDINVNVKTLIKWFKETNKEFLMSGDEYIKYKSLPEKITVYRGVGVKSNPKGLSWTTDIDKARWFAYRFGTYGTVQKAEITKDKVLAFFSSRDEEELIVDTSEIKYDIIEES